MSTTTTRAPQTDYTRVGFPYTEPYGDAINAQIDGLKWTKSSKAPMAQGLAIKAAIKQLRLPKVTRYAINGVLEVPDGPETAAYGIYGIECNYADARVRVYVLDKGSELIPLCMDVWKGEDR